MVGSNRTQHLVHETSCEYIKFIIWKKNKQKIVMCLNDWQINDFLLGIDGFNRSVSMHTSHDNEIHCNWKYFTINVENELMVNC